MRHQQIDPALFTTNRQRLRELLLPNSLAIVNANDIPPTNADGTMAMAPNADLFYLSGVEQEQSILLLYPDADDEKQREILFLREPTPRMEIWEGHKLTKEEAPQVERNSPRRVALRIPRALPSTRVRVRARLS